MRIIKLVGPNVFQLRKNYGDSHRRIFIAEEKVIEGTMRRYGLFNGSETNASAIAICSYQTWNERHGPKRFRKWLKKQDPAKHYIKKELGESNTQHDMSWPANLSLF